MRMPYLVEDKIEFLASASKILSSSLDYNVTLVSIAKLVVDSVADFCMIDILEGEFLHRVVVKMYDPAKNKLAQRFYDFPPDPRNKYAIYDALSSGSPIIIEHVTSKWLSTVTKIQAEKKMVKDLNFTSLIFVPLQSRGRTIGVMTIASTLPGFSYSDEDAAFIRELADRAAITVDKAKLYTEAQEAIRTRDEFLSIASHELKTPLTSILLSLQLVLRRLEKSTSKSIESQEILRAVEISIEQSKRMARLINDLLDITQTSSQYFHLVQEKLDMSDILVDIERKFEIILKDKKIKLEVLEKDKNIKGYWDKIRLEQAISNIISNAIKYGKGKPITLTTEKLGDKILIKIKDRGIGISEKDKGRIFQVFNRGSGVKNYKGIGVGLFITKNIIEAHGGELSLISELGEGTEFIIILPTSRI
jgi:signal transduction histidine kinase